MTRHALAFAGLALASLAAPAPAQADILSFRIGPKADFVTGSGDVFQRFENNLGGGLEVGTEILFIDLYADFLAMGDSQFMSTVNLGFDVSMGSDVRFNIGLHTGPMFFIFPKEEPQPLVVPDGVRRQLESAGVNVDAAVNSYNQTQEEQAALGRVALGWNLARLRTEVEFKIAPVLYFGLHGSVGYHYLISGEEVAAGAKNQAVDDVAREYGIQPPEQALLRDTVGAKPVDVEKLNGTNFNTGVFFRIEI